jgi:hypothetical protein
MDKTTAAICIKIAACVCGKDGLISQPEEKKIFELVMSKFPDTTRSDFDTYMDAFFESDKQIEDYIRQIDDSSLRDFVLFLAEESASADGLELRENIALQKIRSIWSDTKP